MKKTPLILCTLLASACYAMGETPQASIPPESEFVVLDENGHFTLEGIYEPVKEDEKYIAFALYSTDGQPLEQAKKASMSLVSTSFNTGFKLGEKVVTAFRPPEGSVRGELPVLVARVGATVEAAALDGMSYTLRDWHMQEIGKGKVENGVFTLSADQPVFVVEFERL